MMQGPPLTILILAAGSASRMRGADKLLQSVDNMPQLRRITQAALTTDARVLVALPPDRPARLQALAGLAVQKITVLDAAEGMAASIRAGVLACDMAHALMILPADMPELTAADLSALITAWRIQPNAILRASTTDGRMGHPVIFPPDLQPDLAQLSGDQGARAVLQAHKTRLHALPLAGERALLDLDTPEAWAAWYAGQASV